MNRISKLTHTAAMRRMSRVGLSMSSRSMSNKILVVAEHDQEKLTQASLATITCGSQIGGDISVLVYGNGVGAAAAHAATVEGVSSVQTLEDVDIFSAETTADIVSKLSKGGYTHVLTPSSNKGKNFLPRAAAIAKSSPLTDVISVVDSETFQRPMYAGNAISTVKMTSLCKFILVRGTSFEQAAVGNNAASISSLDAGMIDAETKKLSSFVAANATKSDRPDLNSAGVVVAGGRGLKSKENFDIITALADKLGGAVGASRAAVDAGYAPNEQQVGQTGKQVAPDLYIAAGISGAIQHLSGMKDSKTIVAINKDKEAPIFQVADYGLVDDLFKAVPDMTAKLQN